MKPNHFYILSLAVMLLSGSGLLAAEAGDAGAENAAPAEATTADSVAVDDAVEPYVYYGEGGWIDNPHLAYESVPDKSILATRFGWWGVSTSGSRALVGEWQGLQESSPFYDVDGLFTNGNQTADFYLTGPEGEANMAGLNYYHGPGLSADVDYRRFIHRQGADPIGGPRFPNVNGGFPDPPAAFYDPVLPNTQRGYTMFGDTVNLDQDYALRVQQLDANFDGNISQNLRWKLNVWGMKKDGVRQAKSMAHCYAAPVPSGGTSNTCHVVSRAQQVDWLTMQVEPGIEARFDWLTVEYTRTMRSFQQSDDIVTNAFTRNPNYGWGSTTPPNGTAAAFAYVPENYTEIDRIKLRAQIGDYTDAYVMGFVGNTHNEFRDSDRKFWGVDGRLTNYAFDNLTTTLYGKTHVQNNSPDTTSLNDRYPSEASLWLEQVDINPGAPIVWQNRPPQTVYDFPSNPNNRWNQYLGLVDRQFSAAGIKSRWLPFYDSCSVWSGLAATGGYEYSQIKRDNVTYMLEFIDIDGAGPLPAGYDFTQPTTVNNMLFVGLQQDWSRRASSWVRYRFIDSQWPIVGVTERQALSLDAAINSNQPEHVDRIEIGSTYGLADNLVLNGQFWIENMYNKSEYVNFDEDSYPWMVSAWWGATDRLSVTTGYAQFTNWITQDITLGREDASPGNLAAYTAPWNNTGRSDVVNAAVSYLLSSRMRLHGGAEYVRSENFFVAPTPDVTPAPVASYDDMGTYSAVNVDIYRLNAGFDYALTQYLDSYFRYNYFEYGDNNMSYNSGIAHMLLGGVTGTF